MTRIVVFAIAAALLAGCAVPTEVQPVNTPSGFWIGLWHGLILFFSFIGSLFSDNIAVYDAHNKGGLYDLGFLIGVILTFGGSSASASRW